MTPRRLLIDNLRYFWRTHLGVAAGAAIATAVLVGALVVGDSVRYSLRRMALARLGDVRLAMSAQDRTFTADLAEAVGRELNLPAAPLLDLRGIAIVPGEGRRAAGVHVLGVDQRFWALGDVQPPFDESGEDRVVVNRRLADQLGVRGGERIVLRFARPSALSRDIPLGSEMRDSAALSLTVAAVAEEDRFGRFGLQAEQIPPFNAFVPLSLLQREAEAAGRANTILLGGGDEATVTVERANAAVDRHWTLADADAELRPLPDRDAVELRSERVFIDPPIIAAARRAAPGFQPYLTYFVDELRAAPGPSGPDRATPYSLVTAIEPPASEDNGANNPLPPGMGDDRIVITQWLADDLGVGPGDPLTVRYPVLGPARRVEHEEAEFIVAAVVPTEPPGGDRHLMPELPGLTDADSPLDWRPPPELGIDLNRIRDKDERYWDQYRGAPKAFVTLDWAQQHWSTRFGDVTSLRWPAAERSADELERALLDELDPASIGLFFRPVREAALAASGQGTDFGGLFIGLSFFLMVAALLLTALLFVFGVEQRSSETGTLLALGFTAKQVRRLWLAEGGLLSIIGAVIGLGLGVAYTRLVLWALTSVWSGAVAGTQALSYHAGWTTLLMGAGIGIIVAVLSMWWVLRRQARRPARVLLASRFGLEHEAGSSASRSSRPWALWLALVSIASAVIIVGGAAGGWIEASAGAFFGAGALLLVGGLLLCRTLFQRAATGRSVHRLTLHKLGWRNSARRVGRSLATVSMLACGSFLIVSVNAFRRDASADMLRRDSGTGGFALYAETTLPVHHDLNTAEGLEPFALTPDDLPGVRFVQMRLRGGDDASCLNLNRPQTPALLGVDPAALARRDAFTFVETIDGAEVEHPWRLLAMNDDDPDAPVPAILDATVAQWILHKGIGETIRYNDERGRPFDVKIVGTLVSNTVLQGRLLISEAQFTRRYPSISGYRVLLIDVEDRARIDEMRRTIERALADVGVGAMTTARRLAFFNAVQNTYLTIFGVLGGLGMILGCVGLGIVVLRNVLERRGELALMRSVGFARRSLRWLVLSEHWVLLGLGLAVGVVAAAIAVMPALLEPGADVPWPTIAWTLAAVLLSGVLWTALAAFAATRGEMIDALRDE